MTFQLQHRLAKMRDILIMIVMQLIKIEKTGKEQEKLK